MWIGTQSGVAYHDGQRFRRLSLPPARGSTWVQSIAASRDGAVWLGMIEGEILRYANGAFTRYGVAEGLDSARPIRAMLEVDIDKKPTLFSGTMDGLYRLEGERWIRMDLGPGFEHAEILVLREGTLPTGEPTLWVGTRTGLLHCEGLRCGVFATAANGLPTDSVSCLLETAAEGGGRVIWVGTRKGLVRYEKGRWESIGSEGSPLSTSPVRVLAETVSASGKQTLWIGTYGGGLVRYSGGSFTVINKSNSGLLDDYVMALEARGPALWIGTNAGSLARLRHDGWVSFTQRNASLPGSTNAIAEVPVEGGANEFWVGADDKVLRLSEQGFSPVLSSAQPFGSMITFLLPSRREPGVVWIGSDDRGLHRLADGQLQTYSSTNSSLPGGAIEEIRESLDGRALWIATATGAARLDEEGRWQVFDEKNADFGKNIVITVLETARKGGGSSVWFGTIKGLLRLEDGRWKKFGPANAPLGAEFISSLTEVHDTRGARSLWIGTIGGGIARYDLDAEAWLESLDEKSQPVLPDNAVCQVRQDGRSRIYVFTNRGVARLSPRAPTPEDPAEFSIYTFTSEDGLPTNDCNQNGAFVDSKGRIWTATASGLAALDPAEEIVDRIAKPLEISGVNASGAPVSSGTLLPWNDNTVSFEYALLSPFRERDTRYRIELLGFDTTPSGWSLDTKARYTNLPPGSYSFQVWGRDYAGNISGPGAIVFQVKTAPWKTWWAYLGYGLGLAGFVYAGVRARFRALGRRNIELEREVKRRTAELEAAKEAADAASQAKSSFLASMSHELRTPLNAILGYAQILERSPRLLPDERKGLGVLRSSGEHLLGLINDVLDIARVEAGRMELEPSDVFLPSLARTVADICSVRAAQKGISFHYIPDEGVNSWVRVDEKRLIQVLLNLLGNAIKFTHAGSVTFRVEAGQGAHEDERSFRFCVEDTGPGIAPADIERIFQPFEQANTSLARAEGVGLGLPISHKLIEQMGGRIEVESEKGKGSIFTVTLSLPLVRDASAKSAETPVESVTGYEGERKTLLVVDDNEDNRAFLRDALVPLGFELLEAENGEEGLRQVETRRPEAVIVDLAMPVMDGAEMTRRIRANPALAALPVIASSATVRESETQSSVVAGCDAFLPKPVRLDSLYHLLEQHLGLRWIRAPHDKAGGATPPKETITRLADLAERGRIQELVQQLDALLAEDPELETWVSERRALAEDFELVALREKLTLEREKLEADPRSEPDPEPSPRPASSSPDRDAP